MSDHNLCFNGDSPLPLLEFDGDFSELNVKFTIQGAPKEWERLLIDAYEVALDRSPSMWSRMLPHNNSNNATSRTIQPIFDFDKARKLGKINRLRNIFVKAEALNDERKVLASCTSQRIALPEEFLFDVTRHIDCEPKRWKILLDIGRKTHTKPSSTPMQISVEGASKLEANIKLDLEYESSDLDRWSSQLGLLSLKDQFDRLKRILNDAQFIEDLEGASQSVDRSVRRWTWRIDNFTFSFTEREDVELQKVYLGGERVVIPVKLTCEGAEPIKFEIEVLPYGEMSVDMMACDWGTSVSTSAFYSPAFDCSFISAGLPKEQKSELRSLLKNWFVKVGPNLDQESKDAWYSFVLGVVRMMGDTAQKNSGVALKEITDSLESTDDNLYKCWKAVESCLPNVNEELRKKYRASLYGIYREVFSCFPFEKHGVKAADLESEQQISSEFCFDSAKDELWSKGRMGRTVAAERRKRESNSESTENYFRNPKSKIYQIASSNVCDETYSPLQVCQGAMDEFVSIARKELSDKKGYKEDRIPSLVLTYPVTLTAKSRKRLVDTARSLGFPGASVIAKYDESIAPAIFYLDKSFGNFDELGLEAFKVKCSYGGDGVWRHNMLIADLGAYTLDISVVQIEMRERIIGEFGGRAYEVKPMLLGAIGLEQSAGNALTLYVYHLLKIILARFLTRLGLTSNDSQSPDQFGDDGLTDVKLTYSDFFIKDEESESKSKKRARDVALVEACVKTYFKDQAGKNLESESDYADRIKRFNWLWEFAEAVKIAYCKRKELIGNTQHSTLDLYEGVPELGLTGLKEELENPESEFSKAFRIEQTKNVKFSELDDDVKQLLVFSNDEFEGFLKDFAKEKIVDQAVSATQKALETRCEALVRGNVERLVAQEACQGVHSVVLSGRAMRTPRIKEAFESEIRKSCRDFLGAQADSTPFARPSTNIVFEDRYAKTATSIGALRAAQIESQAFNSVEGAVVLDVGRCCRDLDVRNLLHSLPSSFMIGGQVIFELQDEFAYCDFTGRERIRYKLGFCPTRAKVVIIRSIGKQVTNLKYAECNFEDLCKPLGNCQFENIRVNYEINPELFIFALVKKEQDALKYDLRDTPQEYRLKLDSDVVKDLFNEDGGKIKLNRDVCVRVCTNEAIDLFKAGTSLEKDCVVAPTRRDGTKDDASENGVGEVEEVKFATSSDYLNIPNIKGNRYLTFSFKNGDDVKPFGEIELTNPALGSSLRRPWENKLRVALTSQGEFVLFVGDEPDYWETYDAQKWNETSGMVLRVDVTEANSTEKSRLDPFNGRQ